MIVCDHYLPGYKAGGPIASVSRIIAGDLKRSYRVITRDRDLGDHIGYPNVRQGGWTLVQGAEVWYARRNVRDTAMLIREAWKWRPQWYYFNSLFSLRATLVPLVAIKLRLLPSAKVMIAPRGELAPGALAIKKTKKRLFAAVVRWAVGGRVTWHVSSRTEGHQIREWWGDTPVRRHQFVDAMNPAAVPKELPSTGPKELTVLFASRIDRKKGLLKAIDIVSELSRSGDVNFTVAGSVSDERYWSECKTALLALPNSVRVTLLGSYHPHDAPQIFGNASVLLLPTQGENFGHVIAEALSIGCPVVIYNTTPWSDVVRSGGGKVMRHDADAVQFLRDMRDRGESERLAERAVSLESYREWFAAHQNVTNPFDAIPVVPGRSI